MAAIINPIILEDLDNSQTEAELERLAQEMFQGTNGHHDRRGVRLKRDYQQYNTVATRVIIG